MSDRDKAFGYAVSKWGTSNTPARENLAFADGWKAALDWTMTTTPSPISDQAGAAIGEPVACTHPSVCPHAYFDNNQWNCAKCMSNGSGEHPADVHLDDWWVDLFAKEMKVKLASARAKGRGGWQDCSPAELSKMLREHVEKGDPRDVANFCVFLWALRSSISTAPTTGSAPEINQCDGCRVNAPLTERYGNHAMPDGGFMACTKDRYAAPTQGADDTQVVIAGLNALLHDAQDEIARLTAMQGADGEILRPVAIEAPRPSVFRSFETMCWPAPCEALCEIGHRLTYDHSDKSDRLVAASVISAYQHLMSMPAKRRDAIVSELRKGPGVIAAITPMEKT